MPDILETLELSLLVDPIRFVRFPTVGHEAYRLPPGGAVDGRSGPSKNMSLKHSFSLTPNQLEKPTATKTATKPIWPLASQGPNQRKSFRMIWCREGGSNPH